MGQSTSGGSRVQIGAVVAALKDEFPEVSISKIRFLESEGLVKPKRAVSGYRYFSEGDIERIRFVLRAQRDRFWPLKVIAEALNAMDRGLDPPVIDAGTPTSPLPRVPDVAGLPTSRELAAPPAEVRLTEDEIREASGLDEQAFAALKAFGLVLPGREGYYTSDDLAVAGVAARLASHGIEARHLRPFRLAADRELALVEQTSAVRGRDAAAVRDDLLRECLALHVALVRSALHRT